MPNELMDKYFKIENEKDLEVEAMKEVNSRLKSSMILQIATTLLSSAIGSDTRVLLIDPKNKTAYVKHAIEYAYILDEETSVDKIIERDGEKNA